jgi:hypothetical protein
MKGSTSVTTEKAGCTLLPFPAHLTGLFMAPGNGGKEWGLHSLIHMHSRRFSSLLLLLYTYTEVSNPLDGRV